MKPRLKKRNKITEELEDDKHQILDFLYENDLLDILSNEGLKGRFVELYTGVGENKWHKGVENSRFKSEKLQDEETEELYFTKVPEDAVGYAWDKYEKSLVFESHIPWENLHGYGEDQEFTVYKVEDSKAYFYTLEYPLEWIDTVYHVDEYGGRQNCSIEEYESESFESFRSG